MLSHPDHHNLALLRRVYVKEICFRGVSSGGSDMIGQADPRGRDGVC